MIAWWQILLLTLYAGYQILDELQIYSSMSAPVFAGFFAGLVMGDMKTGLLIGAQMQLTVLGVGTFGGASKIDANSGTIMATAFAVSTGMSPEKALVAIGVPVATILIYTDILARFTNTFFAHRIDAEVEKQNYGKIQTYFLAGALPWALSRMIPVFLALALGGGFVTTVSEWLTGPAKWLGDGMTVAGAVLPAVGFAILLRYLPVKKHIAYLMLGFTFTTLFSTLFGGQIALAGVVKGLTTKFNGLSMLMMAIIALAFAIISYNNNQAAAAAPKATTNTSDEGEIDDDEL